ncbi:MAG: hypothetical protein Q7K54_01440 [Candidatus Parcubacteria bacterium]|nr:hypothetical protein [Candidatus Parcubacteria bacterium]
MSRRRIFARYKVPSKEEFGKGLEEHAKFFNISVNQYLDSYIRSRLGDINESNEKIFREKERIKKAKECIKIASSFRGEAKSRRIKLIKE